MNLLRRPLVAFYGGVIALAVASFFLPPKWRKRAITLVGLASPPVARVAKKVRKGTKNPAKKARKAVEAAAHANGGTHAPEAAH